MWTAIDVDAMGLPAIKATWSRGSVDAPSSEGARGPRRQAGARRGGGPRRSWASRELGLQYYRETFGDRSRVERSFGSLKRRTRASSKDINVKRSRTASLDMLMNIFFVHYNGPRP